MHYIIMSCSPQNKSRSTSAWIAELCCQCLTEETEDTAELYYLNERSQWNACRAAVDAAEQILCVTPLYVEGVPGMFLEFLETFDPKKKRGQFSFILQGGFEEASQLRTAERFLQKLPEYLHGSYGGTLIKGGMFGMAAMRGKRAKNAMEQQFRKAMEDYNLHRCFTEQTKRAFAGLEYYSKRMLCLAKLTSPLNRLVWTVLGKRMGAERPLADRPYQT